MMYQGLLANEGGPWSWCLAGSRNEVVRGREALKTGGQVAAGYCIRCCTNTDAKIAVGKEQSFA